jgi:hypothetical protein
VSDLTPKESRFDKFMNWMIAPIILGVIFGLVFGWGPLIWAIYEWYKWWWSVIK